MDDTHGVYPYIQYNTVVGFKYLYILEKYRKSKIFAKYGENAFVGGYTPPPQVVGG